MPVRTLRAVNLPERERIELSLVLPLLGDKEGTQWELTERPGADAAIVDADAKDKQAAMLLAQEEASVVITLSISLAPAESGTVHVRRPLRTQALSVALAQATHAASRSGSGTHQQQAWRLKRWPDTATLRGDRRLTVICGALVRGPQSVAEIATRTGIEDGVVNELLELLLKADCVEHCEPSTRGARGTAQSPPRGLLNRLRARFSAGWN